MLFAIVDGNKVEAAPKTKGTCLLCGKPVSSKCGEINIWHWAHLAKRSCDKWHESETKWHKNWKYAFGIENSEISIVKEAKKHIADIQTNFGTVIELQNSPINKSTILEREQFYGEKMLWIINGLNFKDNFQYKRARSRELDNEEEYYYKNNPLVNKQQVIRKDEYNFTWTWFRKSWGYSQRPIFIDLGNDNLFFITEKNESNRGKGKLISKNMFLEKHGGNPNLLESLIFDIQSDV